MARGSSLLSCAAASADSRASASTSIIHLWLYGVDHRGGLLAYSNSGERPLKPDIVQAEEQIAAGLKEFGVLLNTELEYLKRKFVIETKFKSKQEAYEKKLEGELDAVTNKLDGEKLAKKELEAHKIKLQSVLKEAVTKLEADLSAVKVRARNP